MAPGSGVKFKNKGSFNPQDINKRIEKRFANRQKQEALKINANLTFVHPMYASAPSYPIVPDFASSHAPVAYNSWAAIQGEKAASRDQIYGYIFLCNGKTKPECFSYRVFGLPAARLEVVVKIKPNTKLFLFDFDLKLLYGVYIAASNGSLGLEPTAFGGKFPAQVRFEIFKDCLPLPECAFKHVIKDNYHGVKFKQELSNEQVNNLISLFRQTAVPPSAPVAPLSQNAVQPWKMPTPGIEEWVQPPAKFPPPDDQHVAGLQLRSARLVPVYQHVQQSDPPPPYEPHGSSAHMACVQPAVQSQLLLPVGPQPYCDPYYPEEAHQPYRPENPALPLQDPYSRYTAVLENIESEIVPQVGAANDYYNQNLRLVATNAPVQAHAPMPSHEPAHLPSSSLVSAYWTAVASRVPNPVYSGPYEGLPSGSTGLGGENISVSLAGAQAHAPVSLEFPAHSHEPAHLPSSSLLSSYWATVASEIPNQVYSSPYQRPPSGNSENVAASLAGTNAPVQAHALVPSQFPASSHELAYLPSTSRPAAYWAAVATENVSVSLAGAPPTYH